MNTAAIKGRLVVLRPLTEEHVSPGYVAWLNDPDVSRYLETRFALQSLEAVLAFVKKAVESPVDHLFGIFLATQERHVGNIKVGPVDLQHSRADVSLFIGEKELWGCGLASDAIRCASWFGFKVLGLRKLEAGCYEENIASCKAFQGCGYSIEGILRDHLLLEGKSSARTCLGLTQEDWRRQSWCNEPILLGDAAR